MQAPWLLEVEGVTVSFGGVTALDGVSFRVRSGEVLGIIGPNGAGKTTLFNALSGLVSLARGSIRLSGREISRWTTHRIAQGGMARTLQTPEIYTQISLRDNLLAAILGRSSASLYGIALGLRPAVRREAQAREEAEDLLAHSLLREDADRTAGDLPFGHQRLLEIYRALTNDPRVMLLDEPLSGLTREEADVVLDLIREMRAQERAVLIVEHDLPSVLAIADRILVLAEGRVIADGTPDVVQQDAGVRRVYLGQEPIATDAAEQGGVQP